jgi:hypothetical protein
MERRKFTCAFKLEAVRLIKERGVSYIRANRGSAGNRRTCKHSLRNSLVTSHRRAFGQEVKKRALSTLPAFFFARVERERQAIVKDRVKGATWEPLLARFRFAPKSEKSLRRSDMTRWARGLILRRDRTCAAHYCQAATLRPHEKELIMKVYDPFPKRRLAATGEYILLD